VRAGIVNGLGGAALGELALLTQPTAAVGALARYKTGQLGTPASAVRVVIAPLAAAGTSSGTSGATAGATMGVQF
jgi:hypothetical protein